MPPYWKQAADSLSILLSLLLFVLAGLICNATGGFASRLARCLAFATAAKSYALLQVTSFDCFNSLHGFISILFMKIFAFSDACKRKTLPPKIAYILEKYITNQPPLSRRIRPWWEKTNKKWAGGGGIDGEERGSFCEAFLFGWICFILGKSIRGRGCFLRSYGNALGKFAREEGSLFFHRVWEGRAEG